MHIHEGRVMSEFTVQLVTCGVGIVIGSYFTAKWLAYRTRKMRHARENALKEIANHKWNNGTHNDAMHVTRIALRGLSGE